MVTGPLLTPVTSPVELIVAMDASLECHVPPVVDSFNCVVLPAHTVAEPEISATEGAEFTVIVVWSVILLHIPSE